MPEAGTEGALVGARTEARKTRSNTADREQHVVVDGVALRSVALRRREEGASAQASAALDEGHVEGHRSVIRDP